MSRRPTGYMKDRCVQGMRPLLGGVSDFLLGGLYHTSERLLGGMGEGVP